MSGTSFRKIMMLNLSGDWGWEGWGGGGGEMQKRRGGGVICVGVRACIRASDRQYCPRGSQISHTLQRHQFWIISHNKIMIMMRVGVRMVIIEIVCL